ncbi:unnamed protein product, partial [Urochloa humidicola]
QFQSLRLPLSPNRPGCLGTPDILVPPRKPPPLARSLVSLPLPLASAQPQASAQLLPSLLPLLLLPCLLRGLCIASLPFLLPPVQGESQQDLCGGQRLYHHNASSCREKLAPFLFCFGQSAGSVAPAPLCRLPRRPRTQKHCFSVPAIAGACRPHLCADLISSVSSGSSSRMAEHWALMTGRLITESTLRSAIHESFADAALPSTTPCYEQTDPSSVVSEDVQLGVGKAKSGIMVECRICQEEGDEAYVETPCSCKGSLKYAHHRCIQRWCNEKGDTICEICLQQLTPNYTAPVKLFRHGRNLINFRRAVERRENHGASYGHASDQSDGASSFDSQSSNPKGIMYCRVFAVALMALLVFRDAILLILRSHEVCSIELITLMFRTAGIVIPVYVILIAVTALLHRCNQRQVVHEMPVSEPRGAGDLQPMPPQQQQHIINIR